MGLLIMKIVYIIVSLGLIATIIGGLLWVHKKQKEINEMEKRWQQHYANYCEIKGDMED